MRRKGLEPRRSGTESEERRTESNEATPDNDSPRDPKFPSPGGRTNQDESNPALDIERVRALATAIEALAGIGELARVRDLARELVDVTSEMRGEGAEVVSLASRRAR